MTREAQNLINIYDSRDDFEAATDRETRRWHARELLGLLSHARAMNWKVNVDLDVAALEEAAR